MTRCARKDYATRAPLFWRPALLLGMLLLTTACASTPPPLAELDAADAALLQARNLQADALAPVELGFALAKRADADAAVKERNYARAQMLAAQAAADAALASAKSRAAAARAEVQRKTSDNATLRSELLGAGAPR